MGKPKVVEEMIERECQWKAKIIWQQLEKVIDSFSYWTYLLSEILATFISLNYIINVGTQNVVTS